MLDSTTLNHAARILAARSDAPADAVLRDYLASLPRLPQRERRAVSRAVFSYFRWRQWLEPRAPVRKQLEEASDLQERFERDPRSVKPETLAARAVPDWLRAELELPGEFLQHLQREPALWLRARPGTGERLAATLGHCTPAPQSAEALRFTGHQD